MTRIAAIVVVLAGAVVVLGAFGFGDRERGNRLYREGRLEEAVAAYQEALAAGDESPELLYNLGTALLGLGRLEEAESHLAGSLRSIEPELRQRAHYNLGHRYLVEARSQEGGGQERTRLLEQAVEAYKHALRLDPGDADAKWNLELALRDRDELPPPPQAGGGGDDDDPDDGESGERETTPGSGETPPARGTEPGEREPAPGELSQEQADRILRSVEHDERELYRDKLRRGARERPVLRDW